MHQQNNYSHKNGFETPPPKQLVEAKDDKESITPLRVSYDTGASTNSKLSPNLLPKVRSSQIGFPEPQYISGHQYVGFSAQDTNPGRFGCI